MAIAAKSSAHRAAGLDGAGRRHGQKAADKGRASRLGAQEESSEPANQELLYAARESLDRSQMLIDDRFVNLSPGVAVTVEIKTGSRRTISYLLSPLVTYKQSALRER